MTSHDAKELLRSPRTKSTRTMVYGQIVWLFLVKSGWLPVIAYTLYLPENFFTNSDIAGHVCLALSWFIREVQEFYRFGVAIIIRWARSFLR